MLLWKCVMSIMESLPLCLWKGLTLPIPTFCHLPGLQALCSNTCLSLGDDILHYTVVVSVAFRHQRAFLLMTIPRRNHCGSASVEKQETVEINLFLPRVICGSRRVVMEGTTFALPLAWCDCRQVISSLWSNFMSLKV